MKKLVVLLFAVLALPATASETLRDQVTPLNRTVSNRLPAVFAQLAKTGNADVLEGLPAKERFEALRSKHPDVFGRAAEILRERGYTDTGRVTILRIRNTASAPFSHNRHDITLATDVHMAEGEVTLWEWYDGVDENWEGNIHMLESGSGNWINVDAQLWATEELPWQGIWNEPIAGYQNDPTTYEVASLGLGQHIELLPSFGNERSPIVKAKSYFDWYSIRRKWEDYLACVGFGCGGVYAAC